jgi:predicted  nucleic acid-binding Zn-ribbon protein
MSEDPEHDVLAGELRETLTTMQKSVAWVQALTKDAREVKATLKQLEAAHRFLQEEYQKTEHNLKVAESMVVQLSAAIKENRPVTTPHEALCPSTVHYTDTDVHNLTKEIGELKDHITYQNAEIQRLLERYERDTIPPGLRFKTGIDIKFEHDDLPGGSLLQGGLKVGSSINNL